MKYIDIDRLRKLNRAEFLKIKPYPHYNSEGVLTEGGFRDLLANMPPLELFKHNFGYERRAGQAPHDRYSLEYEPGMPVPRPWQEFIGELRSDAYRNEIARLLGAKKVEFRFHWHFNLRGCSASESGVPLSLALHPLRL